MTLTVTLLLRLHWNLVDGRSTKDEKDPCPGPYVVSVTLCIVNEISRSSLLVSIKIT